jgi:hypothetical protein
VVSDIRRFGDSSGLFTERKMWRAIAGVHPPLQLTKNQAEAMMKIVAGINGDSLWERALTKNELDDFAKRMGLRFRTMARHITGTAVRHPEAAWLVKLGLAAEHAGVEETADHGDAEGGDDEDEANCEEGGEEEHPEEDVVVEPQPEGGEDRQPDKEFSFFYGFDWELKNAWRKATIAGDKDPKEYATQVVATGGDDGHPVASFSVGTAIIKAITNTELKALHSTSTTASLWSGTTKTGAKVRIGR